MRSRGVSTRLRRSQRRLCANCAQALATPGGNGGATRRARFGFRAAPCSFRIRQGPLSRTVRRQPCECGEDPPVVALDDANLDDVRGRPVLAGVTEVGPVRDDGARHVGVQKLARTTPPPWPRPSACLRRCGPSRPRRRSRRTPCRPRRRGCAPRVGRIGRVVAGLAWPRACH